MEDNIIPSGKIVLFETIGSWFANGNLIAYDDEDNEYRIHVDELLASLDYSYPNFKIIKKRVHKYLEVIPEDGNAYYEGQTWKFYNENQE
jgi:hypothetical protein